MSKEIVQADCLTKREENVFCTPISSGVVPSQMDRRSRQPMFTSESTMSTRIVPQHDITTNFSEEKIVIVRRSSRRAQDPEKASLSQSKYMDQKEGYIAKYIDVNTTDVVKVQLCIDLISYDVEIKYKYKELNFQALLDQNMVRRRINCLTQALGILEKYASNLIKPNRPAFWRQVKFTSSLVRTYLNNVHGSYDILKQMGYTKKVPDGLSFDDDVKLPNIEKVKVLAAELFLAKYESDELTHERHPYLEIKALESVAHSATSKIQETVNSEDSEPEFYDAEDGLSTSASESHTLPMAGSATLNQEAKPYPANDVQCHVCGENKVKFSCEECDEYFCADCVKRFHGNRKRQNHKITEVKRPTKEEKAKGSPPTALQENYNETARRVVPPMPHSAARPFKRPVPTPRKRIPNTAKPIERQSTAPSNKAVDAYAPSQSRLRTPNELPPPPTHLRRPSPEPEFPRNASRETIPRQPSTDGEREIKRPPPFDEQGLFGKELEEEHLYESLKMPSENLYEGLAINREDESTKEEAVAPPPLPPRLKPRSQSSVTACPRCYCLNEKDVTKCVACGSLLTTDQRTLPGTTDLSNQQTGNEEMNTFNRPVQTFGRPSQRLPGTPTQFSYENPTYGSHETPHTLIPGRPMSGATTSSYPGIPEQKSKKWECSHCTFHNDIGTKICTMCSKTTDNPVEVKSEDVMSPAPSYNPIVSRSTNISQRIDTTSPQPLVTSMAFDPNAYSPSYLRSAQSSSDEQTSPKTLTSPSYIKLQQDELTSLQLKPLVSSPEVVSLQQQEEKMISRNILQQTRETARHLQMSPAPQSPVVAMSATSVSPQFVDPKSIAHSHGGSTSGYGSQEGTVLQYLETQEMREAGRQFVNLLKEAERLGFSAEELNIAYNLNQDMGPIRWLQTEWFDRIHRVMIEFTNISNNDNYGNISPEEAREALIEHTGDVKEASQKCVKDRKNKLNEVMKKGVYIRTDAIKALDINDGNVELATQHLQRITFEPMLQRIKDTCINDTVDNREQPQVSRQLSHSQDEEIFEAIVSNKEIDMDRRIRVMFAEKNFVSWGRASTAIKLIDMNFPVSDSIEAANVNGDLQRSIQYLQRECVICFEKYPESRMVTMLNCQCRFCQDCVSLHFSHVIHEQNIMKLVCPQCSEPKNLEDATIATEYFNHLDILIRRCVDSETHDLFQRKLRDRTLMREPNFRWCSHCSSGFINELPHILKMACPNCKKYSCFQCKKEWEDQHDGITCEQFAAWKEANDPEAQAHGLAAHLRQNGIECPNCKFRYDLAKGGCMHFKCVQCSHEFCSGCYQPFRHNQHCPVSPNCARRGLHAHHPRDCLFYLRDRDPPVLKKLLDDNNVEYNTEPPQRQAAGADDEVQGAAAAVDIGPCKVMEQRESEGGLQDVECGRETLPGYAGLCRLHFIEYLVERINSYFIDPVGIFDINDLKAELIRNDLEVPEKKRREKDKDYHKRIVKYVREKLPLPRKTPRRRILDVEEQVPAMQAPDELIQIHVEELEGDGPYVDHDDHQSIENSSDSGAGLSDEG